MILAILQARMSSSRLPGKVLRPLGEEPMLGVQLARVNQSHALHKVVVATSVEPSDDPVAEFCEERGQTVYRGSLHDVLDRFYQCALEYHPFHVVRLTGDCPLSDPAVIDKVVELHLEQGNDFTSNTLERTYADGLDVEVMTMATLERMYSQAQDPSHREHVTKFITDHQDQFKIGQLKHVDSHPDLRLTVDEEEDFGRIEGLVGKLGTQAPYEDYLKELL